MKFVTSVHNFLYLLMVVAPKVIMTTWGLVHHIHVIIYNTRKHYVVMFMNESNRPFNKGWYTRYPPKMVFDTS